MKSRNKKIEAQNQTPITDGDARPDLPLDRDDIKKSGDQKNKLTKERGADTNTLEDYKDTKS